MSLNAKKIYLGILLRVKNNSYTSNNEIMQDLKALRKLLTCNNSNENMQKVEKKLKLLLTTN